MTHTLSYFRYRLKSSLRGLIFLSVIAMVFCFVVSYNEQAPFVIKDYNNFGVAVSEKTYYDPTLGPSVALMCILCYIAPVWQFAFFKKRRNLDCVYSLPITRTALAAVHYGVGLISVLAPFTLCYLQNIFMLRVLRHATIDYSLFLPHYLFCVLFGIIMYNLLSFAFNEGNTVGDGIAFMFFHTFVPSMFCLLSNEIESDGLSIPWIYLSDLTSEYSRWIHRFTADRAYYFATDLTRNWLFFWIAAGIVSGVLLFVFYRIRKTEDTGEISNSFFGYRVLIPYFAIIFILLAEELVLGMILIMLAIGCYAAYRRGFRFKISDWVIIGLMHVAVILSAS